MKGTRRTRRAQQANWLVSTDDRTKERRWPRAITKHKLKTEAFIQILEMGDGLKETKIEKNTRYKDL